MKLFLQAPNDGIVINHEITVTVESIDGDSVCLSIDAPPWMRLAARSASVVDDSVIEASTVESEIADELAPVGL